MAGAGKVLEETFNLPEQDIILGPVNLTELRGELNPSASLPELTETLPELPEMLPALRCLELLLFERERNDTEDVKDPFLFIVIVLLLLLIELLYLVLL
jgi:hypothetical protein